MLFLGHLFKTQKDIWDILQVISAVLIPIVIGFASYWIQKSIAEQSAQIQKSTAEQSVAKDYVGIATTILERPKDEGHDGLRDWAVDLLTENSPLKFTQQQLDELKSGGLGLGQGTIDLLNYLSNLRQSLRALSFSPDGKRAAVIRTTPFDSITKGGLNAEVYDNRTGKMIFQFPAGAGPAHPTLVWSPDSSKLLVSDLGTVSVFDGTSGKWLGRYESKEPNDRIESLNFSDDGRSVSIKGVDGATEVWQLP